MAKIRYMWASETDASPGHLSLYATKAEAEDHAALAKLAGSHERVVRVQVR